MMESEVGNSTLLKDAVLSGKPGGPLIIAGPCSAESESQILSIARQLSKIPTING